MWNLWDAALLALTPIERWSAVRRVDPRPPHEYSPLLAITLLLFALVVLLWLAGRRRKARSTGPSRELFWDKAVRRTFGAREREILAAIAARSGLRRREDVVTAIDAFDRGAAKLLRENAGSRTPEELTRLRADVARLREKLASGRGERAEARIAADERAHPISMNAPGAVARFPLTPSVSAGPAADSPDATQTGWFEFAPATVTQVEGLTLQISSLLPVQVGETILVVLRLPSALRGDTAREADRPERLMGHIGRVTDVKAVDGGTSITAELISVADMEVDAAAQLVGTTGNMDNGPMSSNAHGPVTQGV
jgi:hypothetical protein